MDPQWYVGQVTRGEAEVALRRVNQVSPFIVLRIQLIFIIIIIILNFNTTHLRFLSFVRSPKAISLRNSRNGTHHLKIAC